MYKNCKKPEWAKEITNIPTKEDKQPILQEPEPKPKPIKVKIEQKPKLKPKPKKVQKYESSESVESESEEESEDECIPVKKSVKNPFRKYL